MSLSAFDKVILAFSTDLGSIFLSPPLFLYIIILKYKMKFQNSLVFLLHFPTYPFPRDNSFYSGVPKPQCIAHSHFETDQYTKSIDLLGTTL